MSLIATMADCPVARGQIASSTAVAVSNVSFVARTLSQPEKSSGIEGATCGVVSAFLASKRCTLRVECEHGGTRSYGQFDISVESGRRLRFGIGGDALMLWMSVFSIC